MTGYLTRLARRATGPVPGLRPRTPAVFEQGVRAFALEEDAAPSPVARSADAPPRAEASITARPDPGRSAVTRPEPRPPETATGAPERIRPPVTVQASPPPQRDGDPTTPTTAVGHVGGLQPPAAAATMRAAAPPPKAPDPDHEQPARWREAPANPPPSPGDPPRRSPGPSPALRRDSPEQHDPPREDTTAPIPRGQPTLIVDPLVPSVAGEPAQGAVPAVATLSSAGTSSAVLPRLQPPPGAVSSRPPEISVTIGRIEVLPANPAVPTPPPAPKHVRRTSAPDLATYLRDRGQR